LAPNRVIPAKPVLDFDRGSGMTVNFGIFCFWI